MSALVVDLELTPSQRTVAALVTEGKTNAEIAEELWLSVHTVHNHVNAILQRNGMCRRSQIAVAYRGDYRLAETSTRAQLVANGTRAGELSAAVHHALAALRTGRTAEAITVLQQAAKA